MKRKGALASMHKDAALVPIPRQPGPPPECIRGIGGDGLTGFDFDGEQAVAKINDAVQLVSGRIPPEEQGGLAACVLEAFDDLSDDERLEYRSAERVPLE